MAPYSPALPVSLPFSPLSVSTASTAYTAPLFNAAVLPSCASTNIDVDALEAQLSILPNQHFVNALINGLRYGFHIGFSSPHFSVCAPNRPSALEHREVVSAAIAKEVERGHTVGPFPTPPFPVFACSPLGCVPKKPDSWRLILDLSAPAGSSVNDGIPVENGAVQYVRFDQIIRMIAQLGRGALIAKVDLKHAFRQCPVHPDDWPCFATSGRTSITSTSTFLSGYVHLRLCLINWLRVCVVCSGPKASLISSITWTTLSPPVHRILPSALPINS